MVHCVLRLLLIVGVDVSLVEQLETIRRALDELMIICSRITVDITESSRVERNAEVDVTAAERAMDEVERALREAERLLKEEGQQALQQAAEKQQELGHQSDRMTTISREARELADRLVFYFILFYLFI